MTIPNVNDENRQYVEKLIKEMKDGTLPMEPLPCPGGCISTDLAFDMGDRWGVPLTLKICERCGQMRTDPYFTEEALNRIYKEYYRKIDLMYNEEEWIEHEIADAETAILNVRALMNVDVKRVFEIGCGLGAGTNKIREMGYEAIGFDTNIEDAKRLLPECRFEENWEDFDKKADLIILSQVFEHFRDPIEKAKKLRKLLNPGGILYITVPGLCAITEVYKNNFQSYLVFTHPYHYMMLNLVNVMNAAGLAYVAANESIQGYWTPAEVEEEWIEGSLPTVQHLLSANHTCRWSRRVYYELIASEKQKALWGELIREKTKTRD